MNRSLNEVSLTGGGAGGDGGAEDALVRGQVDLDGRVPAGIVDLTRLNLLDGHLDDEEQTFGENGQADGKRGNSDRLKRSRESEFLSTKRGARAKGRCDQIISFRKRKVNEKFTSWDKTFSMNINELSLKYMILNEK